jgi:histidinol-phosphate aminotransferase
MSGSLFRKELEFFRPYVQGKPIEAVRREYGLSRIEKLASNENQFGPSPLALEAMREELENINFYPDGSCFELVGALAGHLNVSPDSLVIGNGGEGLLWLISMAFLNAGEEIVTSDPSFDIYSMSAVFMGAKPVKTPLRGQRFDIGALIGRANDRTKILYLANPNNPTGHIASREEMANLIEGIPEDVILVLDEAYHEFASAFPDYPENSASLPEKRPNTNVLRT